MRVSSSNCITFGCGSSKRSFPSRLAASLYKETSAPSLQRAGRVARTGLRCMETGGVGHAWGIFRSMRLHCQSLGAGLPVLILHGLFGSSDNWLGFARNLASQYRVLVPDFRNHGKSPHSAEMNYPVMAEDLRELLDKHRAQSATVIGHSMGGKVAMQLALDHPERVSGLVVVDIAPRRYDRKHDHILSGLLGLDISRQKTRLEIETALSPSIPDSAVRRFLLKGVESDGQGGFRWRMGIREIAENYDRLGEAVHSSNPFQEPVLFIRGERSDYIASTDEPAIRRLFPKAHFAAIPRAGHWVHADNPGEFEETVMRWLSVS